VLAALFAAGAFGALFGVSIFIGWFETRHGGTHRVHNSGYAGLNGAIVTVGFLVQNWRPETKISAFYQVVAAAVASLIAGLLSLSVFALIGLFIAIAAAILLVLHPFRSEVLRPQREGFSAPLMGLTVLSAVPLVWFAESMSEFQRIGVQSDPHVGEGHWVTMAAMALGILLAGSLAAFKFRGWHITAWSAGAAAFLYGVASVIFPTLPGSEGTGWGVTAMLGGAVFVAVAEWERRRVGTPPSGNAAEFPGRSGG
jgi:hypothetical protein